MAITVGLVNKKKMGWQRFCRSTLCWQSPRDIFCMMNNCGSPTTHLLVICYISNSLLLSNRIPIDFTLRKTATSPFYQCDIHKMSWAGQNWALHWTFVISIQSSGEKYYSIWFGLKIRHHRAPKKIDNSSVYHRFPIFPPSKLQFYGYPHFRYAHSKPSHKSQSIRLLGYQIGSSPYCLSKTTCVLLIVDFNVSIMWIKCFYFPFVLSKAIFRVS